MTRTPFDDTADRTGTTNRTDVESVPGSDRRGGRDGSDPTDRRSCDRGPSAALPQLSRRAYLRSALVGGASAALLGTGSAAAQEEETLTENTQTSHDGHFVSFWTDTPGTVSMTLEPEGSYGVEWENTGNFVVGKGWNPGDRRTVEYTADYAPTDNSYLCLYGWTTDPLVEYYVIESHGTYRPEHDFKGTVESDGGTYDIYESLRVEQPSIEGTATFPQYWSIRQSQRTSGTITVGNHFDAWESNEMPLGDHDYQIMATEAYNYQGQNSAHVTIGSTDNGGNDDPPEPSEPVEAAAVNAGGDAETAYGESYVADDGYDGGQTYTADGAIDGTTEDALYQSERYGESFAYEFAREPGTYDVDLHFAETYHEADGERVFDVLVDGTTAISDLDIHAEVGHGAALTQTVTDVEVTDGPLTVAFEASVENAKVSAIRVSETDDGPTESCGGVEGASSADVDGHTVCDLDGDGHYRDVNGDGTLTNGDVTTFFSNQHAPAWNERTDLFDFTGDGNVGQADVIELFTHV